MELLSSKLGFRRNVQHLVFCVQVAVEGQEQHSVARLNTEYLHCPVGYFQLSTAYFEGR